MGGCVGMRWNTRCCHNQIKMTGCVVMIVDVHVQNEALMKDSVITHLHVLSVHENEDGMGTGTIVAASPSPYTKVTPGQ